MKLAIFGCAAAFGLVISPAAAQEFNYSIAPGGLVASGEAPYAKPTRTPNEIYNQHPLLPYKTPGFVYNSYPTFEIRDAEIPPARRRATRRR